jgi:hypothetical protein
MYSPHQPAVCLFIVRKAKPPCGHDHDRDPGAGRRQARRQGIDGAHGNSLCRLVRVARDGKADTAKWGKYRAAQPHNKKAAAAVRR